MTLAAEIEVRPVRTGFLMYADYLHRIIYRLVIEARPIGSLTIIKNCLLSRLG